MKQCCIDGCSKQSFRLQRCFEHYHQQIADGIACKVPGCAREPKSKGYCTAHYQRWLRGALRKAIPIGKVVQGYGDERVSHPLWGYWNNFVRNSARKIESYEICNRWTKDFWAFVEEMGTRPTRAHTLIRIDESAPYSPDNCAWATAVERKRFAIKLVPLSKLQEDILLPGIEKHLIPLLLYRGSAAPGRIHRLWNFAIAMMKTECASFGHGAFLSHNEEYAQLCGPERPLKSSNFYGLFSRLRLNPKVTDNIPGLTEYVAELMPHPFDLTKVSLYSHDKDHAPWRIFQREKKVRARGGGNVVPPLVGDLVYPYVLWEKGNALNRLTVVVNAMVPGFPDHIRADICQDLIVDLLSGDLSEAELIGSPRKYVQQKLRRYRDNAFYMPTLDDTELIDVLQYDEAKRRFDDYVEVDPEDEEWKDFVEQKLGDVFRVLR